MFVSLQLFIPLAHCHPTFTHRSRFRARTDGLCLDVQEQGCGCETKTQHNLIPPPYLAIFTCVVVRLFHTVSGAM